MPAFKMHFIAAVALGTLIAAFQLPLADVAKAGDLIFFCVAGTLIPDIFDPPSSASHRKFFHSLALLAALSIYLFVLLPQEKIMEPLNYLALGYLSHLYLDAMTERSLPII